MPGPPANPGAPAAAGQRRLVIALVVVVIILLVALALVLGILLGKGGASTTGAVTSPAPTTSPGASAPSGGGSPVATDISGAGSLLGPGPGSDPAAGRGNAGSCDAWVDSGWTKGDCALVPVNGTDTADRAVAYVTEHKSGATGEQWRVFIMTTAAGDAYWHTKLYYSDESGGAMVKITVKAQDTTGGGRPDLMVGFRHNKTSGGGTVLDYDVIMRSSPTAPLAIVMHRQIADGSVVIAGTHVNDYESGPSGHYTRSDISYSGGLFHLLGTSQVASSAVPASLLP